MAVVLNNIISGELSNSYCDVSYADDYWAGHYNTSKSSQWAALSTAQKTQLLIHATRIVETARYTLPIRDSESDWFYNRQTGRIIEFSPERLPIKLYAYQRLQFPRSMDIYTSDMGVTVSGVSPAPLFENQSSATIPTAVIDTSSNTVLGIGDAYIRQDVLEAQCEQALYILNFDESALSSRLQGVTLDKIGLGRDNISLTQEFGTNGSMFSPVAFEMLRGLMVRSTKMQRS